MLKSKLFKKAFSTIAIGALLFGGVLYLASVPWVRQTVEQQEETTGRLVLNNIYELASSAYQDISSWHGSAMESRQRELRSIVSVVENAINQLESQIAAQPGMDTETLRQKILDHVRTLTYGQHDYVFIADYHSFLISHPDDELHGSDYSQIRDYRGSLIVPPMVEGARRDGEGFHRYWWRRLGENEPSEKLSYYRHLPDREWVIGTGVYIDDVDREVEARLNLAVKRLREHLSETRIAKTGYLYVFDSRMNMIIHPNPNIDGTNFSDQQNPVTGQSIGEELMKAAHQPEQKHYYKWDKPDDPGRYIYDKISWIRYLPGLDWYIASSVYVEELKASARKLTSRMIAIGSIALLLSLICAYFYLRNLIIPVLRLTDTASRVEKGDLTAKLELPQDDEIGLLARNFNAMVERLRDQIHNMEQRVAERTTELAHSVRSLEKRNHDSAEINLMGELLQACLHENEAFQVAVKTCKTLFPGTSGRICLLDEINALRLKTEWGSNAPTQVIEDCSNCWAVRSGRSQRNIMPFESSLCPHCREAGAVASLCVPLFIEGAVGGVVKLIMTTEDRPVDSTLDNYESLLTTVAKNVGLSVTNLRLRERLRQQSIKDPLTGLFNRRYLEETLTKELSRALRRDSKVGLIMMDADHFKRINDTCGHEVGDRVLREIGKILRSSIRKEDFACRYGGEEFTLVIPDADNAGLHDLAELVRSRVRDQLATVLDTDKLGDITISAGIAQFPDHGDDMHTLLKAADDALYAAKRNGRNRVVVGSGSG